ncbi:MAG: sulfatase-like hydrolase/transferase [bacterium]
MNRRLFLRGSGLAALGCAISAAQGDEALKRPKIQFDRITKAVGKPNILVIMSDDHAAYVCGAYGNPRARTPNIDRLAASGVRFTNAYANSPMCTPSRQSLITGRLPHAIGVTMLPTALSDDTLTIAELLKEHGYNTGAIGKMHFNSSLRHGFDHRLDLPEHQEYLKTHPTCPIPEEIPVFPTWRPFKDPASVWLNGSYLPYGAYDEDMAGTWIARETQTYLRNHADKPFCLVASFYEPHSPFRFPVDYRGMYDPKSFDVPEPGPEDDWQIPEIFRNLTRSEKQHITASYYTSTAFMDKNVGLVLDTLEETGLDKNTVVIYLGDHGYNLGHHGRFEKHCSYEEAVRAPLITRFPGLPRQNVATNALVEFIDIFPTIAEACGAPIPENLEGRSLLPIIRGETKEGRNAVFSEYMPNEEAMVRTKKYKFVYSSGKRLRPDGYQTGKPLPGRTRMLFDVENDPNEMTNLAGRPEYAEVVEELEREMLRRFEETHPGKSSIPSGLNMEDSLDWYVNPREEKW